MKTLFLEVTQQLKNTGIFKFIDMDKGQLDNNQLRPSVVFPCALVKCSFPSFDEYGGGAKNRNGIVRIRIAFEYSAMNTSTLNPEESRLQSLSYIDDAEDVFENFRKFEPGEYTSFEAKEFVQEDRSDGLVVIRMTFLTNRIDI